MESVLIFFQTYFPILIEHKYLWIFLGASIEGPNTVILAGFLASMGSLSLWPVFLLCLGGEIINGYIWYAVGYFAGAKPIDKWGRKDQKSRKIIEKVEEYFKKYSGRAIVIAKLTWSLTIATMIMSGSLKYNLKKFSIYNFIGSLGWIIMTFFVGFFFGQSYKFIFDYIRDAVYLLVFLGGAVAVGFILRFIFRSMFVKSLFLRERLKDIGEKVRDGIDKFLSDEEQTS